MAESHQPVFILLQALAWLVFTVSTVLYYLSFGHGMLTGIFLHNMTSIKQSYPLEVCPASWSIYVWVVIHVWLLLWLVYGLTTICRESGGGYLYAHNPLISPMVYFAFAINQICFIATFILVDRRYIGYSMIFMALGIFCVYVCVYLLQRSVYQRGAILEKENRVADIWVIRVLAENGIGFYATWLSLMFLYQLGILIVYFAEYGISQAIASVIILVMITVEIGTWFVLDNFVMDKFSRYTVTPYAAALVFMSAIVDNNWNPDSVSFIFAMALMGCICLLFLVKLFLMFWRHGTRYVYKRHLDDVLWSIEEDSNSSTNKNVVVFQHRY